VVPSPVLVSVGFAQPFELSLFIVYLVGSLVIDGWFARDWWMVGPVMVMQFRLKRRYTSSRES
jgi:hypothetical protein